MYHITDNFRQLKRAVLLLVMMVPYGTMPTSAQQADPEKLQYAREVEQKGLADQDTSQLAEAYYLYGKYYVLIGEYVTSQNYFLKAIHLLEPKEASYELGRLYLRISENESRRGSPTTAMQYGRHSLQIFKQCRSEDGQIKAYDNLRKLMQINGVDNYDTLAYYYNATEKLVKKNQRPPRDCRVRYSARAILYPKQQTKSH